MSSNIQSDDLKNNEEDISFNEIFLQLLDWYRYLKSKWIVLLILGLIGGVLGYLYASIKRPVYTSSTTFVLEEDKSSGSLGSLSNIASIAGVDLGNGGGGIFQGDNILELYKSRLMIQKALLSEVSYRGKTLMLVDVYIDFNEFKEGWKDQPLLKNVDFNLDSSLTANEKLTRVKDSLLGGFCNDINKNYLKVSKPDKRLSIIKADVASSNEFFSKVFNERIVKVVNDFYIQTKIKKSLENVLILQSKADSVRAVMNGSISSAAAITDATPNLNPTRLSQRVVPVQKSQFSAETNKMMLGELVKNLELAKISLRKEMPLIQVIDEPVYPLKKEVLSKVKALVIGGFLLGFCGVVIILLRRFFNNLVNSK